VAYAIEGLHLGLTVIDLKCKTKKGRRFVFLIERQI
jgi:hypothetical protein